MSIIDTLITDRSAADLSELRSLLAIPFDEWTAEQQEQFDLALSRGAYNASDLNRVNDACLYLAGKFREYGYQVDVKLLNITDEAGTRNYWKVGDIPLEIRMQQYLQNVQNLRSVFKVAAGTPEVPDDIEHLTIEEANNIELVLVGVETLLNNMAAAWLYSGEIYSGEVM